MLNNKTLTYFTKLFLPKNLFSLIWWWIMLKGSYKLGKLNPGINKTLNSSDLKILQQFIIKCAIDTRLFYRRNTSEKKKKMKWVHLLANM